MSDRSSILYMAPGKVGGVITNLCNLQRSIDRRRYAQHTILTYNQVETDTNYLSEMPSERNGRFVHAMPLENLYSVLRRLRRIVPPGAGVLVSSDWLELAFVSAFGTERKVFQVLHGDFDYYYELAVKHEPVVDAFVGCSRRVHERLTGMLPHRRDDIHYVPYGVPIPKASRSPAGGRLRLLYAGRIHQGQKRVFDLVAIERAVREAGVDVEWTIAGTGPDEGELRRRFQESPNVHWAGLLSNEEVKELMFRHDVFVLPSQSEGLPLALLEAMSMGLVPVVSNLESGVPDVVLPGQTGIVADVGDTSEFARAICTLHGDRPRLEQYSAAARELIIENHDIRSQASHLQALFEDAEVRRRPGRFRVQYGSRLDRPWLPNALVRFIRERRRPELRALRRNAMHLMEI